VQKNRILPLILAAFALFAGLFLPFLTAAGQNFALQRITWPLTDNNAHYSYQGTLINRVVALNAHLNGSPAVQRQTETASSDAPGLISALSAFLPIVGAEIVDSSAFVLSPRQYNAEYHYLDIAYELADGRLAVTVDAETQLPLRTELSMLPERMNEWLRERSLWDILHEYAACLNLGEPTDDDASISTVIRSQSAQLRGTSYKMTVTVIPSAGSLLLQLTASTPA